MKRSLFWGLALLPISMTFSTPYSYTDKQHHEHAITYHNRPLIKINGKTISLVDVIKRMDFQILKQSPYLLNDIEGKHQYYSTNWRQAFQEIVENELVLLDAEPLKFSISEGDIREELDRSLGTNIISKLDDIGMTLEEAKKHIQHDMMIRQMLWFKAYSKAVQTVTPEMVKSTYTELAKRDSIKSKEEWKYQMVTVKCQDSETAEKLAHEAYGLLSEKKSILADIPQILKNSVFYPSSQKCDITISKELAVESGSIAKNHQEILSKLSVGEFSKPEIQQVKNSKEQVHRIFILNDHTEEKVKPFDSLSNEIKDRLIQMSADKEKKSYIDGLKDKFLVSEQELSAAAPKDFEPFALI